MEARMEARSIAKQKAPPSPSRTAELQDAIRRRAREIYEKTGRIPGRDVDNWIQAEAQILREYSHHPARRAAVVVRLEGVQYVGEYRPGSGGYAPGEFAQGDPVPIRFDGNKMYVRRPNGQELETRIVNKAV
jgi:Protein of unknown function (DUF2934)